MRFIYSNLIDDNTITASTESGNYTASNLQKIHLSSKWRTTAVTAQTIVVDAGTGNVMSADCIAIANHNLSTAASITIQANSADSWAGPGFSATVTWRSGIIIYYFASAQQEQFYRFLFDDQANTDAYIEMGRISLSEYLEPSAGSIAEFPIRNARTDIVSDSISNQMYSDEGVGYRTFEYRFPPIETATAFASITDMWDSVGRHKPFFFMNFNSRFTEIEPAYVRLDGEQITGEYKKNLKVGFTLIMKETA